jgi:hypothetical protein
MARTYQPSPATQRKTATTPLDTNTSGSFDTQNQRGENGQGENRQVENGQLGDNTERRENLTAVQDQPDNDRDDSRTTPGDREFVKDRDERKQHDGYTERGSWSAQPPTPSAGMDAFAPVLEAWKQVFKSWSELAETMVKAQQDAFANMISAANTTAKNINVGDRQDRELAFSGSRTTASTPDRIERDRR